MQILQTTYTVDVDVDVDLYRYQSQLLLWLLIILMTNDANDDYVHTYNHHIKI